MKRLASYKHFIFIFIVTTVFLGSFSFSLAAHKGSVGSTAGLTSESPIYFIDEFFEDVRLFFAFNPEVEARLHVDFISERLSEITALLSKEVIDKDALDATQERIIHHIDSMEDILSTASVGMVSGIARDIDSKLHTSLQQFNSNVDHIESDIYESLETTSTSTESVIPGQEVTPQTFVKKKEAIDTLRLIESTSRHTKNLVRREEERIESFITEEEKVAAEIDEVESDFTELRDESREDSLSLPSGTFMTLSYFDAIENARSSINQSNLANAAQFLFKARESVEAFRGIVIESKQEQFNMHESKIDIAEAEFYFNDMPDSALNQTTRNRYTRLISQARAEFEAGNYNVASDLSTQAREVLISNSQ